MVIQLMVWGVCELLMQSFDKNNFIYQIVIRKVNLSDMRNVYELSNQDYVRKYSINRNSIDWNDHVKWFNDVIRRNDIIFYVAYEKINSFIGQVRFQIQSSSATVSISVTPGFLGKGVSAILLGECIIRLRNDKSEISNVIAFISNENLPSIRLFEKCGFLFVSESGGLRKYTKELKL